ncbi:MAG: VOC family protein [Sulfuritalea sp.]|nr:VOC family protein [Sulfuritalea sp.]
MTAFHYAFPITDIGTARDFYVGRLGCAEGRSTNHWIDFELFGHQLSAHLGKPAGPACEGSVDGHAVPIPHFGAILPPEEFWRFADRLRQAGIRFLMEPTLRFAGKPGEQATMFFLDPDGNALEFKAFTRADEVFARQA